MKQEPWLKGWKSIAKYIGSCVDTAQKYHKLYNMPVQKMPGRRNASVMAAPSQIDDWILTFNKLRKDLLKKKKQCQGST